jgi:large subunit ribosomal protein L9
MKVLLVKNVKNVGQAGEIKDLTEGYVRNFLLPQKMATLVTVDAIARHQASLGKQAREQKRKTESYKKLLAKINAVALHFSSSANESGVLYGAITPAHIREKLQVVGITVSEQQLVLTSPIKDVGTHQVKIILDHNHQGIFKVVVTQSH